MTDQPKTEIPSSSDVWRQWSLRVSALVVVFLPFIVLEITLHICGVGQASEALDPFIDVTGTSPFFTPDESGKKLQIDPSRLRFFQPASFDRVKKPGTFRIFCLGGSTVQGRPYAPQTAFSAWLQLSLQAAAPQTDWEIVNCGGVSYASYRLAILMREIVSAEPDLIVLCTGHNEFLEQRTYAHLNSDSGLLGFAHRMAAHLRMYTSCRDALTEKIQRRYDEVQVREKLPNEVHTLLDLGKGLDVYTRDDPWRQDVISHFRHAVRDMLELADVHHIPVLVLVPPVSLSSTPPFKSENTPGLDEQSLAEFNRICDAARKTPWQDVQRRRTLMEKAVALNPRHAGTRYHLGFCYAKLGLHEKAREQFICAKDEDICPLRAPEAIYQVLHELSHDTGTPLIDVRELFQSHTEGQKGQEPLLIDHVHPTIEGHQLIADSIVNWMQTEGMVALPEEWEKGKQDAWAAHLSTLDAVYFRRGLERAERLRLWTHGSPIDPPDSDR